MAAQPKNQIDKEAVRLLAIEIGVREAARRLGLNEDRVCKWSERGKWFATPSHVNSLHSPVSTVSKPGDVLLGELQEHEQETRLSLARSVRRMSKYAESATLRDVDKVHKAAQTMAIVHRQGEHGNQAGFTLNVLNLGSLGIQVRQDDPGSGG